MKPESISRHLDDCFPYVITDQMLQPIKRYAKEHDTDIQVVLIEVLNNFWEGRALP